MATSNPDNFSEKLLARKGRLVPDTVETSPLDDLSLICEEIFERWDKDMRSGKLLTALAGRAPEYDSRVDRIRAILAEAAKKA